MGGTNPAGRRLDTVGCPRAFRALTRAPSSERDDAKDIEACRSSFLGLVPWSKLFGVAPAFSCVLTAARIRFWLDFMFVLLSDTTMVHEKGRIVLAVMDIRFCPWPTDARTWTIRIGRSVEANGVGAWVTRGSKNECVCPIG